MNDPERAGQTPPASGIGRILAGIAIMIAWVLAHVALYLLVLSSGVVTDLLLHLLRSVIFPGMSAGFQHGPEPFAWAPAIQSGLTLTGAAGIPLGLLVFWRRRRVILLTTFLIAFLAGAAFEIYALYIFISNALTVPS